MKVEGGKMAVSFLRLAVLALAVAVVLPGCRIRGRSVRKEPPPPEFVSPLPPVGQPGLTLADIRSALQQRRGEVRSAQAALTMTVGSVRSRGRQQFDSSLYYRPGGEGSSDMLRVRGSADAGPVFDFLLNRGEVQTVIYPEQKFYRGSLTDLRANPQLLAGVQPDDLADAFAVERTLLQRIRRNPETPVHETPDHYLISFGDPAGVAETFHLRKQDLLVDRIERTFNGQPASTVQYYGYRFDETGGLVPTRYDAVVASGAELSVEVGDVRFNASAPEGIDHISVPEGFDRLRL